MMSGSSESSPRRAEADDLCLRLQSGLEVFSDQELQRWMTVVGKKVVQAGASGDSLLPLWFSAWDLLEEESDRRIGEIRELEKMYFGCPEK